MGVYLLHNYEEIMYIKDLNKKIPGASNFRYKEFIKSDVALRKNIRNIPNEKQWKNIEKLAVNVLQPIRKKFGRIRITSGFRSVELNQAIGGSKYSNHCRAEAADVEPVDDNIKLVDIMEYIVENLEFRTVILEYPLQGWIHADYREGGNLKRIKLKDKNHNYKTVSMGYIRKLYG
jgi:uncharacterized protein YcbK (DUF882 family)